MPGDALDGADDPLEDRVGQLLLLLLELLVVLDEGRLELDHLLLPVVDLLLEGVLREDLRLLVDVLLLLLQLGWRLFSSCWRLSKSFFSVAWARRPSSVCMTARCTSTTATFIVWAEALRPRSETSDREGGGEQRGGR